MPGARPESNGPVCAVTAWRASTSRVPRVGAFAAFEVFEVFEVFRATATMVPGALRGDPAAAARSPRSSRAPIDTAYHRVMPDAPVNLTPHGPPDTVLDREPADALAALEAALGAPEEERRAAVSQVVARWPRFLDAWARLGAHARDDVEAYAAFRVGYHRGLDRLRQNGWRGSGLVRWAEPENRGFLRSVAGLGRAAHAIGEADEARRCHDFLLQLDPSGDAGLEAGDAERAP